MTRRFQWGSRELQVQMGSPDLSRGKHRPRADYLHVFFPEWVAGDIGHLRRTALGAVF